MKPQRYRRYRGSTGLFAAPLRGLIAKAAEPAITKKGQEYTRLLLDWPEIAGSTISSYCTPHRLTFPKQSRSAGTLTLAVTSGRALELQHQTGLLIEKIAIAFGYRVVDRITLIQRDSGAHADLQQTPERKPSTSSTEPRSTSISLPSQLPSNLHDALKNLRNTMNGG